jgi:glycerol-3-phosphate dehydrogenase
MELILEGGSAIRAEVIYSVRHEMACTIEDVLARRLGMQFYSWRDAIEAAPLVGSLIAEELQWTSSVAREAVTSYVEKINHLLDSAGLSSNPSASLISGQPVADRMLNSDGSQVPWKFWEE